MTIKQLFTITAAALAVSIVLFLCSCSRKISGVVKEVKGDTLTLSNGYSFKVTNPAALGDTVTFTPTKNKRKVSSKQITRIQ